MTLIKIQNRAYLWVLLLVFIFNSKVPRYQYILLCQMFAWLRCRCRESSLTVRVWLLTRRTSPPRLRVDSRYVHYVHYYINAVFYLTVLLLNFIHNISFFARDVVPVTIMELALSDIVLFLRAPCMLHKQQCQTGFIPAWCRMIALPTGTPCGSEQQASLLCFRGDST